MNAHDAVDPLAIDGRAPATARNYTGGIIPLQGSGIISESGGAIIPESMGAFISF